MSKPSRDSFCSSTSIIISRILARKWPRSIPRTIPHAHKSHSSLTYTAHVPNTILALVTPHETGCNGSGATAASVLSVTAFNFVLRLGGGAFGGSFFWWLPLRCTTDVLGPIGNPWRCFGTSGRALLGLPADLASISIPSSPRVAVWCAWGISSMFGPNSVFRLGVFTPGFSVTPATTLTLLAVCDGDRLIPRSLRATSCSPDSKTSSSCASHSTLATRSTNRTVVSSAGAKWALPAPLSILSTFNISSRL